jgi:hypothetical protein
MGIFLIMPLVYILFVILFFYASYKDLENRNYSEAKDKN